jgi:c-di-GMP-binding flagellar brake protein YcgR
VRGEVRESDRGHILVDVDEQAGRIESDTPVEVVGFRSAYLTTFHSRVIEETAETVAPGGTVLLEPPSGMQVAQRRRYNRVPVRLRVEIRPRNPSRQVFGSRTYEMSALGASVRNVRKTLEPGDAVDCVLLPAKRPIRVRATVSALSHNGKIAHLSFEHIDASLKHRILQLLFRRRR